MSLRSVGCSMLTIISLFSAQITPAQTTDAQSSGSITGYSRMSSAMESTLEKKFQDGNGLVDGVDACVQSSRFPIGRRYRNVRH